MNVNIYTAYAYNHIEIYKNRNKNNTKNKVKNILDLICERLFKPVVWGPPIKLATIA